MIDFRQSGELFYMSSADVSIGNGPGVNEREFIVALYRAMGDRAHFLIPRPAHEVTDIPVSACTFCAPHHRHSPVHYPLHVLSQMRLARRLLSRRRFDMFLFRLDILPLAPRFLTRRFRQPFALKTLGQNSIKALGERGGWLGRSLAGFNRRLVRQLVSESIVADSVSPLQIEFLREQLGVKPERFVWVDNAVNTERFSPESTAESRRKLGLSRFDTVAGYVGTRPWERGGMQLIEAASRLVQKYTKLGVVILGDGPGLDALQRRARELGIEDNCVLTGYVPFHEIPTYVNALDIGVSISMREDRQASSELKVRQYLACGKPVLAGPGGNDFLVDAQLGSIVPPADTETIARELDRWLSLSPVDRREFTAKASDYVLRHLSMDRAIDKRCELWMERLESQATQPLSSCLA